MADVEIDPELQQKIVQERFVFPKIASLGKLHTAAVNSVPTAKEAAKIFYENLESAFMVVSIPYAFADSSVLMRRHNQITISEEIRALKGTRPNEPITAEQRAEAHNIADKRFAEELGDEKTIDLFQRQLFFDLYALLQRNDVARSSHELLLEDRHNGLGLIRGIRC
ncbi:MAG: hypothetical protein WDN50_24380 [Bradyrhizobium sp.]